jgi:kynurenine formamidase
MPDLRGNAVLIRSGWSARYGTPAYWEPGPHLSTALVDHLVYAAVALIGVDFWNVDDPDDGARPVHTRLLGAGIPIVEHLRGLEHVPTSGFRFTAAPVAVEGAASLPVRAFAEIPA